MYNKPMYKGIAIIVTDTIAESIGICSDVSPTVIITFSAIT